MFKRFSKRIIVDISPQKFIFKLPDVNLNFPIPTFIYLDNSKSKSALISIGEELLNEHRTLPSIYKIDIFDLDTQLPPNTTFSRSDLIQIIFEFGIARCFETTIIPQLRPVVVILGADRFRNLFTTPKDELEKAAKRGGAGLVIFDNIDF